MLPVKQYFANAVGAVSFVPDAFVHLHWSGQPLTSPELRALYVHTRNLMLRHDMHCILADHRAMPTSPTPADCDWLLGQWLPQTVAQTRYSHCAVLPAADPSHRLHTDSVVRNMRRYLALSIFNDLDQAADWLTRGN